MKMLFTLALAALSLTSTSSFAQMADGFSTIYSCTYVGMGIPEERTTLEVVTGGFAGRTQINITTVDMNGPVRRQPTVYVDSNVRNGVVTYSGRDQNGQVLNLTILKDRSRPNGRPGFFAPTYSAKLRTGRGQATDWSCNSPRDPQ